MPPTILKWSLKWISTLTLCFVILFVFSSLLGLISAILSYHSVLHGPFLAYTAQVVLGGIPGVFLLFAFVAVPYSLFMFFDLITEKQEVIPGSEIVHQCDSECRFQEHQDKVFNEWKKYPMSPPIGGGG